MSQSGSISSGSEQSETQQTGVRKQLLVFNEYGQPIGEGSSQFSSFVGRVARAHCPPTYINWHDVGVAIKEKIWSTVLDTYAIPIIYKRHGLVESQFILERVETQPSHALR